MTNNLKINDNKHISLKSDIENNSNVELFNYNQSNSIFRIISFFIIMIIYCAWLPSFIEVIINFIVLRKIETLDWLLIAGFLLTIPIIFIYSLLLKLGRKIRVKIINAVKVISPIILIISGVLSFLSFGLYYQLFNFGITNLPQLSSSVLTGFFAAHNPIIQYMFFASNFVNFVLLVPFLYIFTCLPSLNSLNSEPLSNIQENHNIFPIINRDTDIAFIFAGLYLALRHGSLMGSLLDFAIISISSGFILILTLIMSKSGKKEGNENRKSPKKDLLGYSLAQLPMILASILLSTFAYWLGLYGFIFFGNLSKTYVWIFLSMGILTRLLINVKKNGSTQEENLNKKKNTLTIALMWIFFIIVLIFEIILTLASISAVLMPYTLIILCGGLFLIGFISIPSLLGSKMNSNEEIKKMKFLNHPIRLYFLLTIGFIGYMSSLIFGMLQPIMPWFGAALISVFSLLVIMFLIKNYNSLS